MIFLFQDGQFGRTLLGGGGGGGSSTVVYSGSTAFIATDLIGISLSVTEFAPGLGTLTAAELILYGDLRSNITLVLGNAPTSQNVRGTALSDFSVVSSVASINSLLALTDPDIATSATTGFAMQSPNTTVSHNGVVGAGTLVLDLASLLGDVTGSGTFSVTVETSTFLSTSGGAGFLTASSSNVAKFGYKITYTYTP